MVVVGRALWWQSIRESNCPGNARLWGKNKKSCEPRIPNRLPRGRTAAEPPPVRLMSHHALPTSHPPPGNRPLLSGSVACHFPDPSPPSPPPKEAPQSGVWGASRGSGAPPLPLPSPPRRVFHSRHACTLPASLGTAALDPDQARPGSPQRAVHSPALTCSAAPGPGQTQRADQNPRSFSSGVGVGMRMRAGRSGNAAPRAGPHPHSSYLSRTILARSHAKPKVLPAHHDEARWQLRT